MDLFGGFTGFALVIVVILWITGLMKPVRKLANVASDAVETAAVMADREMKKINAEHVNKVVVAISKLDVKAEEYAKAKSNLDAIKAFEL